MARVDTGSMMPPIDPTRLSAHIINLPADASRLRRVLSDAQRVGLDPTVFRARTHADLNSDVAVAPSLSSGEVGCFLSHRDLLRDIAAQEGDGVHLILEDDVVFLDGFGNNLRGIIREMAGADAQIVQLGWIPTPEESTRLALLSERIRANQFLRAIARGAGRRIPLELSMLRSTTFGWGTHCYLVTRPGAALLSRLLDFDSAILAPVDHYLRAVSLIAPRGSALRARLPIAAQDWSQPSTVQSQATGLTQIDQRGRRIST
jgi:GR25 family glycosyltransferase involved in LPS biosynthesis